MPPRRAAPEGELVTSLRVFTCGPYGARLTPSACAQRFPRQVGKRGATAGPRIDRIHCHECPVGAAHARGEDAPGVEYSLVDVGVAVQPSPPAPPPPREEKSIPMPPEKTYAPRPCDHPECDRSFVPSHSRSLYCNVHRTPEAAAARKALREELNAKLDGATEDETHVRAAYDAAAAWANNRRERAAAGWVSDVEIDHTERAKASADEVLEVDDTGEKWVPWRWLLDQRTKVARGLRNVIAATKEAVGEEWAKDRQLAEAVTAKCAFLEEGRERALRKHEEAAIVLIAQEHLIERTVAVVGEIWMRGRTLDEAVKRKCEALEADAQREHDERVAAAEKREAFAEAITPPPGLGAADVLRAVGYRVVTVDSPRGPVIVVEGAHG